MKIWRVVKATRGGEAFTGEGAFRFGGRWNSPGRRAVYCSASKALALLEILVHIDPADAPKVWTSFEVELKEEQIEFSTLAADRLREERSRRLSDDWLESKRTLAMAVPSSIVPEELNYILNPLHADFASLRISRQATFNLDGRLLR